jgi:hypothetical protein
MHEVSDILAWIAQFTHEAAAYDGSHAGGQQL